MANLAENKVNRLGATCLHCAPSAAIRDAVKAPKTQTTTLLAHFEKTALSLGESVARDGVFISRRGSGEGLLPFVSFLTLPSVRIDNVPPRRVSANRNLMAAARDTALRKRPLTRLASAEESAESRHATPQRRGLKSGEWNPVGTIQNEASKLFLYSIFASVCARSRTAG